jgi:hypothetical protein
MKKITKTFGIIIYMISMISFSGLTSAQEEENTVIGEIMEIAAEGHIIMVKDRNYIVTAVFIDDGVSEEPMPTSFNDFEIRDVVVITPGVKSDGFWKTKKVILLTGEKAKAFKSNPEQDQ